MPNNRQFLIRAACLLLFAVTVAGSGNTRKQAGIPTDDLYHLVLDYPEYYKPDGTHFNENGVAAEGKEVGIRVAGLLATLHAAMEESLPPLKNGKPPQNLNELWAGYNPRKEPLDVEVTKEWKQDGVVLRVLRYRIEIFHGQKAMMAAIYGFPEGGTNLPGLLQIHGGTQSADVNAVLANAKRGHACISINWGGRALGGVDNYQGPNTDWGAVDATETGHDHFTSFQPDSKTMDSVESPRNDNWFLVTLAGRRALTFLERQPEVNGNKLGVYGHSMGGNLTLYVAATDDRVKAAVPSCGGGIGDASDGQKNTPFDNAAYAAKVTRPMLFLNPADDFHGTIEGIEATSKLIQSKDYRFVRVPHLNHRSTPEFTVSGLLWLDHYLKGGPPLPQAPAVALELNTSDGVPRLTVKPDPSRTNEAVDIYYTEQGAEKEPQNYFWHHAVARKTGDKWSAELPLLNVTQPLWAYANVTYSLPEPIAAAGFYYVAYTANKFCISSSLQTATPEMLQAAKVRPTLKTSTLIESFQPGWQGEWFAFIEEAPGDWARHTHKLNSEEWKAPTNASLVLDALSAQANKLVVQLDDFGAQVELKGGDRWQTVSLSASDFHDATGAVLPGWKLFGDLVLADLARLETSKDEKKQTATLGAQWQGPAPEFRNLRWEYANTNSVADHAGQTK